MNPFPYIEKWISEHGSAATLRDHVALLKSQMNDFKAKMAESDSRADKAERRAENSEAKVEKLQAELDDARKEIARLKQPKCSVQVIKRRLPDRLRGLDQL